MRISEIRFLAMIVLLFLQSMPSQQTVASQSLPSATVGASPDDSDSLVLPDGTPIRIKAINGFSSENAKVGDAINFSVAFEVRADGLVVIPRRTALTGKVVAVNRPRRRGKAGQVIVSLDALTLPTGEAVTVRPTLKPAHKGKGAKVAEGAADAVGTGVDVFITAGVALFVLFAKGDEQAVPEGAIQVYYLNGPLRISRKAAMALQPTLDLGHAYVYVFVERREDRNVTIPDIFCGESLVANSVGLVELELKSGTYWFSTDNEKERPARLEILPGREYSVWLKKHQVVAKDFDARSLSTSTILNGRVYPYFKLDQVDLTKLTAKEYRLLAAEPPIKKNEVRTQDH